MDFFDKKTLFPISFNKKDSIYFYASYFLLIGWIILSIFSIFFIGIKNIFDGFVIFSIIIRLTVAFVGSLFFIRIFIKRNKDKNIYNFFRAFVGYGVIITYVFYSLPRIVGEFNKNIDSNFSILNFIIILFITLFPAILYLIIRLDVTRLVFEVSTKKDIDFEKKLKKDKDLKKKEQKRIKSERSFLQNLWYEWIDVIIQAILIAMIIQQFLFQMYQIPSESMVPTFLIKDRVVVNKFIFGPHIPLTDWKLPVFKNPKIGDIVVFKNPDSDNPNSEIRYNNVFSRIFHPFIYMLTLSIVDIDKKADGTPKERFLVKRMIAKEGEKLCMVNDKLYKKINNSNWIIMNKIEGQKEFGQVDLFYKNNPNMQTQNITPYIRYLFNESQSLFNKYNNNIEDLKKQLITEKKEFINRLKQISLSNTVKFYDSLIKNEENLKNYYGINQELEEEIIINFHFNNPKFLKKDYFSAEEINFHEEYLKKVFNKYNISIIFTAINELKLFIEKSGNNINFFNNEISTDIINSDNNNPYTEYMKLVNAVNKLYKLKIFSLIIDKNKQLENVINNSDFSKFNSFFNKNQFEDIHNLLLIDLYLNENFFSMRNFPEFPAEKNKYILKDEYFMMGDNRYNSLDCRYNDTDSVNKKGKSYIINLDNDDNTYFSTKIYVSWHPRTIPIKYILGRAFLIYYPFDRIKFLNN